MIENEQLRQSKAIHRRTGKTFHVATRLLPERARDGTYVLYAFSRVADEIVDQPGRRDADEQREAFARLRGIVLDGESTESDVLTAFQDLRGTYDIRDEEVDLFIRAMEMDVEKDRYATIDEVDAYMRGSAAAVGIMMCSVMEVADYETAKPAAEALGKAFQLTNFLRDVREDIVDHGRIYLPATTRERFGVTDEQIADLRFDESFERVMRAELERAEALYREGVAGIDHLPADCQFPVLLAAVLYAEYHRGIRRRGYDVLSGRPHLGTAQKAILFARLRWHWWRTRDPERAFYAVSAVPETPEDLDAGRTGGTIGALSGLVRKTTGLVTLASGGRLDK